MYKNEEEKPSIPMQGKKAHMESVKDFKGQAMDIAYGQAGKKGCEADYKKIMSQMHHGYNESNSGY